MCSSDLPILRSLPNWITREDYKRAKPAPDGYLVAKARYTKPGDKIIGFEDTVRGWKALHSAGIEGVVVSSCLTPAFQKELEPYQVLQVSSFSELS